MTFQVRDVARVVDNKWLSLACGLAMMAASGTQYMYSTYSPQVKELMGYNQSEVNFIGSCANIGIYLGFWTGFVHDRFGARVTSFLSALLLFTGWALFYLGLKEVIPTNYIVMGLFMFIVGNGSSAGYTAPLANIIPKFPAEHRGKVVGLLVALFGLSAAIFTQIYSWVFQQDVETFILFFVFFLPSLTILGVVFLAPPRKEPVGSDEDAPLLIGEKRLEDEKDVGSLSASSVEETVEPALATTSHCIQETTVLQALQTIDFWVLFGIFLTGTGVGLVLFNNLGNMVLSAGGQDGQQNPMVTLLSIVNSLTRLVMGYLSDILVERDLLSRPGLLLCTQVLMAITQLYFAVVTLNSIENPVGWFYPGVIILGISYGSIMSLCPTITSETLGEKNFASNWSLVRVAPALSTLILSTLLAGSVYDRNVAPGQTECYGWACYGATLLIDWCVAIVTVCFCATQVVLLQRYKSGRSRPKFA